MMEQLSMFDYKETMSPLASRLRPESLETFVGQKHLLGKGKLLRQLIDQDQIPSMIFWGPPGVGKTTLASIIAKKTHADFVNFSAVTSGIKEIKEVMARAELSRRSGLRTLVFVDETHLVNKAQHAFALGVGNQSIYEFQNIGLVADIHQRVIVHGF